MDFEMLVHELGPPFVIKHLAITRQQLTAWLRPDSRVPRGQVLALYWESQYGRSVVDSHREFEARNLKDLADSFMRQVETLRSRVISLEEELRSAQGGAYAANDGWLNATPTVGGVRATPRRG